jgi:fatty acid desaturase
MQLAVPASLRPSDAGDLLSAVASWGRRSPVEASAVLLLGLGGAIFPPVWLLGAVVALASRLWDYRDKWLGLALPLLVTLVGTVAGVSVGGGHGVGHSVHEGWVFAEIISRVSAAAGAGYLAWRSVHGRRPPAVPPWSKPHKLS